MFKTVIPKKTPSITEKIVKKNLSQVKKLTNNNNKNKIELTQTPNEN
jgi:hypothetical protein